MSQPEPADDARLHALLQDASRPPAVVQQELAAVRLAAAGTLPVRRELERAEADFLAAAVAALPELTPDLAAVRQAMLAHAVASLATAPDLDVDAPYELAERLAEAEWTGQEAVAATARAELQRRLGLAQPAPQHRPEAEERFAALATAEEELELGHRLLLLRHTAAVLHGLGRRLDDRRLRRLGSRLQAMADDRELLLRLEARLGRRGTRLLEVTSLLLLVLVLLLLLLEVVWTPGPETAAVLLLVDAAACTFFLAEFGGKLWLAPRRWSWFLRNAATDLLPAIPAVLLLFPSLAMPAASGDAVAVRLLRLFRITWAARYVQALQPLLRTLRLLVFLVRGLDRLVARFAPLLNREFRFFGDPREPDTRAGRAAGRARALLFAALRREHELVLALPADQRLVVLRQRAADLLLRLRQATPCWPEAGRHDPGGRELPVEQAVEFLHALQPEDLARHLERREVLALDRLARVLNAPVVRWLPVVRRLRLRPVPAQPEARVVALGRAVADAMDAWQQRLWAMADLHGIVTGPQILDSVATAMVKASQRPAVRLLLFGGLFMLCDLLIRSPTISLLLQRIVVGPLLVLGSVCLLLLGLGWWLKRLAGEAGDRFRLTSEAQFVSLLHLGVQQHQDGDLRFLAARVAGDDAGGRLCRAIGRQVAAAAPDVPEAAGDLPPHLLRAASRTALLYLQHLSGGLFHPRDIRTSEHLLANLSIDNIRHGWLGESRRDRRRQKRLRLDEGSLFGGPYLWFRCITASIAVETSKRLTEYNRRCLTVVEQATALPAELQAMRDWLQKRADPAGGRTLERLPPPGAGIAYRTTEFHALDFLAADAARDEHLRAVFGSEVVTALRADRAAMIREIFGTRPVHLLPAHERSFNALRFHSRRLSRGRVLLLPLLGLWALLRRFLWLVGRVRALVREVLSPHRAQLERQSGAASFATALRKIHRMKAPGLLEAMRLRVAVDPLYCGAPGTWSGGEGFVAAGALDADLAFLRLPLRQRAPLLAAAAAGRAAVQQLHARLPSLPDFRQLHPQADAAAGELGVTLAWLADQDGVRTLADAEAFRRSVLLRAAAGVPGNALADLLRLGLLPFRRSLPDEWLLHHAPEATARLRRHLRRLFAAEPAVAHGIAAFLRLDGRAPQAHVHAVLLEAWRRGEAMRADLLTLRAVQSLSVIDVRDDRELVFRLGRYADLGEDAGAAITLP